MGDYIRGVSERKESEWPCVGYNNNDDDKRVGIAFAAVAITGGVCPFQRDGVGREFGAADCTVDRGRRQYPALRATLLRFPEHLFIYFSIIRPLITRQEKHFFFKKKNTIPTFSTWVLHFAYLRSFICYYN